MRTDDYFTAEDMKRNGPEIWERVRAKLRQEGHEIIKGYGEYGRGCSDHHFIYLSKNGNLVHTADKPKGLQIDIEKFLGLNKVKALKIRTGYDLDIVGPAFEYLVSLGYSDVHRKIAMGPGNMEGLLADSDGIIYIISTVNGFNERFNYAHEIVFDTETKVTLTNFRPKRKVIELRGFNVYEDEYLKWLESNAIKSAT